LKFASLSRRFSRPSELQFALSSLRVCSVKPPATRKIETSLFDAVPGTASSRDADPALYLWMPEEHPTHPSKTASLPITDLGIIFPPMFSMTCLDCIRLPKTLTRTIEAKREYMP
jgi:hypothetical protein